MRRALAVLAAALAVVAGTLLLGAGGDEGRVRYTIELDNAFGLIEGADVKIAGVRAGSIDAMRLERDRMRALIDVSIDREGFGDLREDASCETRPQSLIGEYFIDCRPGSSPQRLPEGGTVRVEQTGSTVPVDLVNNIMRRPYRERFAIILGELGAGLAARGGDLNETIRRASPALRETDRVLAILREQRRTIRDLYRDADTVLAELAAGRKDVSRFVGEARDTAKVSAGRPAALRAQLRQLPRFLAQARETMPLLGAAAQRQEGAMRRLQANAPLLRRFLDTLGPFAEDSREAVRTLGRAAVQGRTAMRNLEPRLRELRAPARQLPEIGTNLALILERLDDRRFAIEKDPASPGGQGFTGLEALLRYVHNQVQAVNLFDGRNYLLKIAGFVDPSCAFVINAKQAKDPKNDRCAAILGPNRPGINQPDPTASAPAPARRRSAARAPRRDARERPATPAPPAEAPRAGERPTAPGAPQQLLPEVQRLLDDLLTPGKGPAGVLGGALSGATGGGRTDDRLLDFLLAP